MTNLHSLKIRHRTNLQLLNPIMTNVQIFKIPDIEQKRGTLNPIFRQIKLWQIFRAGKPIIGKPFKQIMTNFKGNKLNTNKNTFETAGNCSTFSIKLWFKERCFN